MNEYCTNCMHLLTRHNVKGGCRNKGCDCARPAWYADGKEDTTNATE